MDAKNLKKTVTAFFIFLIIIISLSLPAEGAIPPAPSGLEAIAGNDESSLTWGAVPGATRYLLYRGTVSGGPYGFVAETEGTGYADHPLSNGSTYYYVVTGLNSDGQSSYSSQVNITPTTTVLKAPSGLTAVPGNGEVSLSWNSVTSAVSYNIYRATSRGGPYTLLTPSAPGQSFTDRGLTNGASYCYVAQTMSTNAGAYSDEVCAVTSALLPVAPATFTATPGNGWTSLSWSASEGAAAYLVYRGTKMGGPYSFVALPNTNTYEDFELFFKEISYYYVVAAVNASGRGAFSAEADAGNFANEKPHAAVLTAHTYDKEVYLSWSDSVGAVSYTVHRGTTSGGPYTNLGTEHCCYLDTDLVNGATYYYVVDAHNASPTVVRSNEVAVTPAVVLPPPPPTNVAVIAGNTQATVTWDPVGGLQGSYTYVVTIAPAPDAPSTLNGYSTTLVANGAPSLTVEGLTNGQAYYFRVQSATAYSAYSVESAKSAYSTEVNATPAATLPLAPTNIVVDAGNKQVSLTWPAVPGAASYKVYRRTDGSAWSSIPIGSPVATLFTDTGLANGTKYYYSVAAVNADGTGAWSTKTAGFSATYGTPTVVALPAPTNVAVIAGNQQATITWDSVVGAVQYFVTIATSPGGPNILGNYTGGKPNYTSTSLTNGQTYYFRVQSQPPGGRISAYSAELSVIPDPAPIIGNISGHISVNFAGYNNLAVQNATVSLQGTSYTASSDANGNFTLSNIPYGNYGLLVTAPNMDTVKQDISLTGSSLPVTIPPLLVSAANCLNGDANYDKRLNLADAIYLLQILIGERQ